MIMVASQVIIKKGSHLMINFGDWVVLPLAKLKQPHIVSVGKYVLPNSASTVTTTKTKQLVMGPTISLAMRFLAIVSTATKLAGYVVSK